MRQFEALIIRNKKIAESYYELQIQWPGHTEPPLPGRFLTLKVNSLSVPLLRRPFALSGWDEEEKIASVIYQVRGTATQMLSEKTQGDTIDTAGPFGNLFPQPANGYNNIIVAGGIGLGPMLYLASSFYKKEFPVLFIIGCRDKSFLPELILPAGLEPVICTDDGSAGFKGTTVDYLNTTSPGKKNTVYGCGPLPMLKACATWSAQHNTGCYVSLEEIMACATGACMGCVVNTTDGYKRVCKEGPVFNSKEIIWD